MPPKAYDIDLAYIHDSGFGGFARAGAQFLLQHLENAGVDNGLVIELGCGSGITAEIVSDAGYDVLGFDISSAMIDLATARVPDAEFHRAPFLQAELRPCIAVASIGEVFNYLFDPQANTERLGALFQRVFTALEPGGIFLFDGACPGRIPGPGPSRNFTEGADWVCLYAGEEDRSRGILTRTITTFRKVGDLYRREHETHKLQLFRRMEIEQRLCQIGFRVAIVNEYCDLQFPTGYIGFLATKPH